MKKQREPSCRLARGALQDWADGAAIPDAVQAHLARCPRCRRFQEFLSAYPQALEAGLEGRMRGWPAPSLTDLAGVRAEPRFGRRPRWAVAAVAAAALLVAGWGASRLYGSLRTASVVRAAVSAEVERLYAAPLAAGVEGILVRPQADVGWLLEELNPDSGLEGLGSAGFLD